MTIYTAVMSYDITFFLNDGQSYDSEPTKQFDIKSMQELLGNLLYYMSNDRYTVETEQTVTDVDNSTKTVTKITITENDDISQIMNVYELETVTD